MEPWQKWAAHKPRAGQPVRYVDPDAKPPIDWAGMVVLVKGSVAWVNYGATDESDRPVHERFTWCFRDSLNSLHDWPTKSGKCACGDPAVTELDGDNLCQAHADAWCRGEDDEALVSA